MSQVKERLLKLCDELGINAPQFSKKIGKHREYVSKITGEIGSGVLRQIYLTFPTVNLSWIITGDGEILFSNENVDANYPNVADLLNRLEKKSEEVGRLKEEIQRKSKVG